MSDTLIYKLEQVDESTNEAISRLTVEWYGMGRNEANILSMSLIQGAVDKVREVAEYKASTSVPEVSEDTPPNGNIR